MTLLCLIANFLNPKFTNYLPSEPTTDLRCHEQVNVMSGGYTPRLVETRWWKCWHSWWWWWPCSWWQEWWAQQSCLMFYTSSATVWRWQGAEQAVMPGCMESSVVSAGLCATCWLLTLTPGHESAASEDITVSATRPAWQPADSTQRETSTCQPTPPWQCHCLMAEWLCTTSQLTL